MEKEQDICEYNWLDHGIISSAVTYVSVRPRGRHTTNEIECRQNGLLLRDHLKR